jgi:hypothetical protein
MKPLNLKDVENYVESNIDVFHQKRINSLDSLKLSQVLKRKNPYLFKAKNTMTSEQIIRGIVDAHISSNEETIFGDWLEGLAIFINQKVYNGRKSGIPKNENLYLDIIEPLGCKARERNDEFQKLYTQMINKFTREFACEFCNEKGEIDWEKLVLFNSGKII